MGPASETDAYVMVRRSLAQPVDVAVSACVAHEPEEVVVETIFEAILHKKPPQLLRPRARDGNMTINIAPVSGKINPGSGTTSS
jgi:hypothetical protein